MRPYNNYKFGIKFFFTIGLSSLLISCGPMNSTPQPTFGGALNQSNKTTSNNEFYIYFSAANGAPPVLGDNPYTARFVRTKDLQISPDAKVTFTYMMPQMPEMGKTVAIGQRQADGFYTVSLFYSMSGRWQVTIKIEDGGSTDEYLYEVSL